MSPKEQFDALWNRCDEMATIYTYLSKNVAPAIKLDEMLRAEWVARVSAMDLYFHELIKHHLINIFEGTRVSCQGFSKFTLSMHSVMKIMGAPDQLKRSSAFQVEINDKLALLTFQDPEKIADGIRFISSVEFWNEIALLQGATQKNKSTIAKNIKKDLSLIISRRNKIAHEGDLQPGYPRIPWNIDVDQVKVVKIFIYNLVHCSHNLIG